MDLGEIKDIIRDIVGRDVMPEHIMDFALDTARRELEKLGNFYWMRSSKTWSVVASQQSYSITTSTSNGLNLPNFKAIHALFSSAATASQWTEVLPGDVEVLEGDYLVTTAGQPANYAVDNTTLRLYPPAPALTYSMKLWHYEWTSNPTINSGADASDELTNRWPEALIYAGGVWGLTAVKKDEPTAQYYESLLNREVQKIISAEQSRTWNWRYPPRPIMGTKPPK